MAINKKLIHFNKKEDFDREVANNNILDQSIVFIKDSQEIWTHGQLYTCKDVQNIAYGTCPTAAGTATKVITVSDNWKLQTGSIIIVKFSNTNSASNPKFNVNGTGAKSVVYNTSTITTSSLSYAGYSGRTAIYVYNGTSFVFLGWSYDANTTYSGMTATEATEGTSTTNRLISPSILQNKINQSIGTLNAVLVDSDLEANDPIDLDYVTEEEFLSVINNIQPDCLQINHGTLDTTFILTPNEFHVWDQVEILELSLAQEIPGIVNEYLFQFTSGSTATTLILPDSIKWLTGDPEIDPNVTYQCSIINGLGIICGV